MSKITATASSIELSDEEESIIDVRLEKYHQNAVRRITCRVDSPLGNPPQLRQTIIGVVR